MLDTSFYQELLRNSPTLISTHSGDGAFLTVADSCFEVLGYQPSELIGKPIFSFFHPEEMDYHQNEVGAMFGARQEFVPTLSRFRRKDGDYTWFQSMLHVTYNEDGTISGIVNSQFDITKWVEMRVGLVEQEKMLIESGRLAKVGAWQVDLKTNIQTWTQSNFDIFDFESEVAPSLGQMLSWIDDRDKAKRTIAMAIGSNKTLQEEFNITTDKGRKKYIRTTVNPVLEEGKVVGLIGACQDITDDQKIKKALEDSVRNLEARKRKLEDFNHIVSHNLRSPAANIKQLIQLLKNENSAESRKQTLTYLESTANSLEEQLNELMGIVDLVHGEVVKSDKLDIRSCLDLILRGLNGYLIQTEAKIDSKFEWTEIEYPKPYFDSILLNLVSNALKYSDTNKEVRINIETELVEGKKVLKVIDNGLGINLDKYGKKLFKMRSNVHRERKGNGLGLYYTKEQVEAMGGSIKVESTEGEGSTFTVIF